MLAAIFVCVLHGQPNTGQIDIRNELFRVETSCPLSLVNTADFVVDAFVFG